MKKLTATTAITAITAVAAGFAASFIGLAGAANAAPWPPRTAADTISSLEADSQRATVLGGVDVASERQGAAIQEYGWNPRRWHAGN